MLRHGAFLVNRCEPATLHQCDAFFIHLTSWEDGDQAREELDPHGLVNAVFASAGEVSGLLCPAQYVQWCKLLA